MRIRCGPAARCGIAGLVCALSFCIGRGCADEAGFPPIVPDPVALRLAIADLAQSFPKAYAKGAEYLARVDAFERRLPELKAAAAQGDAAAGGELRRYAELACEALLANPLLDFDKLLVVRRGEKSPRLGLANNWESNSSLPHTGYDDEIDVLAGFKNGAVTRTKLFRPDGGRFVGDVDLHWDADRLLFSMPGSNGRWQVCEVRADGTGFRELPLILEKDVDNYDACYLPDGRILFTSTAPFVGVPCVGGSSHVSNLYRFDPAKPEIRRLTFEQDHDWCPTVMPNGRVMYLRWEYSDLPHFVSRILFHMNPDGTEQMEYYGSNSYWPNSIFYARPCPGSSTRFVGIVGGHHDVPRMGELVLFDVAQGRREAEGVVQRIPGRGKVVEPKILDNLVSGSWPKFLHPWPLSDKYVICSMKPSNDRPWGVYLVDVFDNLTLLHEEPGYALFEPIPLKKTPLPPVVPDKVDLTGKDAVVSITDIYAGEGLRDVPRGSVKNLRIFTYHFAYHGMGGQVNRVGLDGPWDVKRIVGTVPVEADGSACFRVPANTPIAVQPLDEKGRALQLMRSWMTPMPGEVLSCTGCHEHQNTAPPQGRSAALAKTPAQIMPWYGPTRGFSFKREVQPVLDAHCVRCHDGKGRPDGKALPDFTAREEVHPPCRDGGYRKGTKFSPSYLAMRSYVRGHTMESDLHLLNPCEFHAGTTRLIQLLERGHPGRPDGEAGRMSAVLADGHQGVKLDREGYDRLVTWIDLNTPYHGTWHEIVGMGKVAPQRDRRREMNRRYAGIDEDPEAIIESKYVPQPFAAEPPVVPPDTAKPECPGWPFDAVEAQRRQAALGETKKRLDLGDGVALELVRIPAGEFVMGDVQGAADERPPARVRVEKPFWMGRFEVTNRQFARFDPKHDSRLENGDFLQFSVTERGYPTNGAGQPVCRVSWRQAQAFCRWLSGKSGLKCALPTEAQWEWACRAGTATALWYGPADADFAPAANLADANLRNVDTFGWGLPSGAVPPWRPAIETVNDHHRVSAPVGSYAANAWGLHDMAGNVWEWTRTAYRAYPYRDDDGRNDPEAGGERTVRGGSWYDRPALAGSAARLSYPDWQRVYNVGFRIVCEDAP